MGIPANVRKVHPTPDGNTVYAHPAGWLIVRDVRDWDWVRGAAGWQPKTSWLVIPRDYGKPEKGGGFVRALNRPTEIFRTLCEATEWCDAHEVAAMREP